VLLHLPHYHANYVRGVFNSCIYNALDNTLLQVVDCTNVCVQHIYYFVYFYVMIFISTNPEVRKVGLCLKIASEKRKVVQVRRPVVSNSELL